MNPSSFTLPSLPFTMLLLRQINI